MKASVIIPSLNRAQSLALCLRSLVAQERSGEDWEVLVVDNGSTDETRDVTQAYIAQHPQPAIRYVLEPIPGLLSGRHRGAREAKGDILIFVDDDIEADPCWLAAIMDTFQDPTVHLVGGKNLPRYETAPPGWLEAFWERTPYGGRMCTWLSLLDIGDEVIEVDPRYVWGLNFAIRRQTLIESGGFHPDCIPKSLQHLQGDGETGLSDKIRVAGRRAIYQPRALVHHAAPSSRLTVEYFENRAFYAGVCNSYTRIRANNGLARGPDGLGIMAMLGRLRDAVDLLTPIGRIRRRLRRAYEAGYRFHQDAARSRPEVLEWILRNDYWDYRLPDAAATEGYQAR